MKFSKLILILLASLLNGCAAITEPPETFDALIDSYGGIKINPLRPNVYRTVIWPNHNSGLFTHSESKSFKEFCAAFATGTTFKYGLQKMTCVDREGHQVFLAVSTLVSSNVNFLRRVVYEFYNDSAAIEARESDDWMTQQNERSKQLDEISYASREQWMARELAKTKEIKK